MKEDRVKVEQESIAIKIMRVSTDPQVRKELTKDVEISIYSASQRDLDKRFTV